MLSNHISISSVISVDILIPNSIYPSKKKVLGSKYNHAPIAWACAIERLKKSTIFIDIGHSSGYIYVTDSCDFVIGILSLYK